VGWGDQGDGWLSRDHALNRTYHGTRDAVHDRRGASQEDKRDSEGKAGFELVAVVAELKGYLNEKARRRMTVTFQDPGEET